MKDLSQRFPLEKLLLCAQITKDIHSCLKDKLDYLKTSEQTLLGAYAFLMLALEKGQQVLGIEATLKIIDEHKDQFQALQKDQQIKDNTRN